MDTVAITVDLAEPDLVAIEAGTVDALELTVGGDSDALELTFGGDSDDVTIVVTEPDAINVVVAMQLTDSITCIVDEPDPVVVITGTGEKGAPGAPGGIPSVYIFTNQASWTINHNLGRIPIVTVLDASGTELTADVENPTLSMTVVTFATMASGTALVF